MAYARLPDTFPFAMETVAAGNAAIGVLCRCMAWSAGNRTDGFVPDGVAEIIGSKKERDTLAIHGLLEPVAFGEVRIGTRRISKKADVAVVMPGDGYWMPEYHVYNVSALEDAALSEKGRKGGLASGEARTAEPVDDHASEPRVQPGVEPEVEAKAELTVEPTRQDKTRHQDRTGNQANPAVKDAEEERDTARDDSEQARAALSGQPAVGNHDDARARTDALEALDTLDFDAITETVRRP